jgi:hypothetical protein
MLSGIRQTGENFEDGRFVGNKTSAEYISLDGALFSPCLMMGSCGRGWAAPFNSEVTGD